MTREEIEAAFGDGVKPLFATMRDTQADVERIKSVVSYSFGLPTPKAMDHGRKRYQAEARHVWRYLVDRFSNMTLEQIGMYTGGCDHSTVIHSINTVRARAETDIAFGHGLRRLEAFVSDGMIHSPQSTGAQKMVPIKRLMRDATARQAMTATGMGLKSTRTQNLSQT